MQKYDNLETQQDRDRQKKSSKHHLTELVSVEKLQQIQDSFADANQIASTITEVDGTPITRPSNHSKVCTMIRATVEGKQNCKISGEHLGLEAARLQKPFHKMCLSCGFSDAAAPIIVDGKHIANWLIGQYHVRDVDEKRIREYSREIDADEEEMVRAFWEMPKITTERFEKVLNFLWIMANEISNMGYLNLQQKRQKEDLENVRARLEEHQLKLEKNVKDRTAELLDLNKKLRDEVAQKNKMHKMQSRLIAAIENTVEAIVITNTVPEILYINPAFVRITGFSFAEAVGVNPNIMSSGMHDKDFFREMYGTIQSGKVWKGRFRNKRKNGEVYDEDTTISPIKDNKGKVINYVAVKRDVTHELEMERQLLQMNKLEAIGTLAAGIAHEINTPVQYVSDNTLFIKDVLLDLLELNKHNQRLIKAVQEKGEFTEETRKIREIEEEIDLDYIVEETGQAVEGTLEGLERITTVVKAMKEFSHPGSEKKQPENLNQIIKSTVTVSRNEWKTHAEMKLDLADDLPMVSIFSGQIKQVVLNLIVNGAHAIAARNGEGQKEMGVITIATSKLEEGVKVMVGDTGTGIPETVIDKIFDPFFTTKMVGKGTGQGLPMVQRSIVDNHGGELKVESKEDQGTEFTFILPL